MELLFKGEAIKQLKKIGSNDQKKARKKINGLLTYPLAGKPLKGKLSGLYSLKAWPLRIIYTFNPKNQTITIQTVEYRGGVYKN
ncbi:MAG: type II toxin-antitoxin system RelE/ParE family toxin [Candidatus Woesebacteria bacterium]|nr:type II toxin-antitoxin system RelE/ParE family toxin [Candidatus Woesebacteria bacterium]